MKRKIAIILAFGLLITLSLSGCGQKDIGEAKAKEIGLAYINKVFDANESEATVTRDTVECSPYQAGAVVTGDPTIGTRVVYYLRVAKIESMPEYELLINGSGGEVLYAWRSEVGIILTEVQKAEANALFAEEKNWGEKHASALEQMRQASILWALKNLKGDYPVLFGAENNDYYKRPVTTTFLNSYYVVMQDGKAYEILIQWPSMQVVSVSWLNEQ